MSSITKHLLQAVLTMAVIGSPVATAQTNPGIVHRIVKVVATNDEWTGTGIKLQPGDIVVILAPGVVRIGANLGEVEADGRRGNENLSIGVLNAKIGPGAGFAVGKRYVFQATEAGLLKLRVQDTKYDDNAGAYAVRIIRMPADALPAAQEYIEP